MAERKHPWLRRMLGFGVLAGAAYAVWRAIEANRIDSDAAWEPQPFPFPPQPRHDASNRDHPPVQLPPGVEAGGGPESGEPAEPLADDDTDDAPWVPPNRDTCPASHPVKAKMNSGIYHVPGGLNYERTQPDRCYLDPAAAEADGLRASKR